MTSKAGPFKILSQAEEGIFWEGGSRQMVSWDVSNTDQNPINTTNSSYEDRDKITMGIKDQIIKLRNG